MSTERYARRIELPDLPVADWTRIPNEGETFKDGTNVYVGDGVTAANALTPINAGGSGTGDVVGPASATDNAIARYNLATGKLIQNSVVLLDDNGKLGQVDAIDFDSTPATAIAERRMQWNDNRGSLEVGMKGGNVSSQVSEDLFMFGYNNSGSPMTKGTVVRVNGSSGLRPVISLAQADGDPNSAETIGVVAESIGNNAEGLVQVLGLMKSLNTNAFNEGDVLYLSPTSAGQLTNVKPQAPDHLVRIAYCIKKAGGAGEIYISPLNGFEIDELHDVRITTPATNTCGLYWNSTDSVWENKTPANARTALGLGTLATQNGTFSGTSSGTNTGDQTITLTGDVTGSGTGSFAATIANDAVTNAKLSNMATATIKGRTTAGTGDPEDLTAAQATALLDTFTSSAKGLAPASGGGTTNFLRADGTWAAPAGGGGGTWGSITGTLSSQTDLYTALAATRVFNYLNFV